MMVWAKLKAAAMACLGILAAGGVAVVVGQAPTKPAAATAAAEPRFHYRGALTDQRGRPVIGATVTASHRMLDGAMAYIDVVKTDQSGRFTIDRPIAVSGLHAIEVEGMIVRLEFAHPDFVYARLEDAQLLPAQQLADLRIELRDGKTCQGKVLDQAGKGVSGALVQAVFGKAYEFRKATITAGDGSFSLRGLPSAAGEIQVVKIDPTSALVAHVQVNLESPASPLVITASPLAPFPGKAVRSLLGMQLMDLDRQLQEALFLPSSEGVLILDAGPDTARLDIGQLQPGDVFWKVGTYPVERRIDYSQVKGSDDFVRQLRATCDSQPDTPEGERVVPVVFQYRRVEGEGTNTQVMRLTKKDVAELRYLTKAP